MRVFLADCGGSRARAIDACGIPPGTVFRWQSDPRFAEQYEEIRQMVAGGDEALRASMSAAAFAMAVGEYRGSVKASAVRASLDLFGFPEGPSGTGGGAVTSIDYLDAEIREPEYASPGYCAAEHRREAYFTWRRLVRLCDGGPTA